MTISAAISSICYSVGEARPVGALVQLGLATPAEVDSLLARGIENFCEDRRPSHDICLSCITDTLAVAGLRGADIHGVVIGHSMARWDLQQEYAFLSMLHAAGIGKAHICGVSMQACGVVNSALELARLLLGTSDRMKNVLVLVFGKQGEGGSRLAPQATTVFSDGAVSCIVSSEAGQLEIVSSASLTDPSLAALAWDEPHFPKFLQSGVGSLRQVCNSVYSREQLSPRDVAAVFGTNGSSVYLQMIGLAAGVPAERVYRDNLARYAHVYGCDTLIGIRDRTLQQEFRSGEYLLSVAWAPNVASACLLRRRHP